MEFTSTIEDFNTKLWRHHLMVPEDIARDFIDGNDRRVICTFNNTVEKRCALMAADKGWFILLTNSELKKLGINTGNKIEVSIKKDNSEYGMEFPEEFRVMLDQDDDADKVFNSITAGKRRSLIYLVNSVKNIQSRINRSIAICDHLKESKGNLDGKRINELIKFYNNQNKLS